MFKKKICLTLMIGLLAFVSLWSQMINNEGFEGSTFPPAGWVNSGGVTRGTPPVGSPPPSPSNLYGSFSAYFVNETQGLIAPKMANPYTLTISAYQTGNGNCAPKYWWSNSLSGPWTLVENFTNLPNGRWNTETVTVNLTNVFLKIGFKRGGNTQAYFDNITITPIDFLFQYRTVASGNWSDPSIWEYTRDNGVTWYAANIPPTASGALSITVMSGHTVTVNTSTTVDEVTVQNGATLNINSGVTLTLNNGSGTDMVMNGSLVNTGALAFNSGATMTAGTSSNITYNGSTAQSLGSGFPTAVNNLTINNSAGVTMNGSCTVNGTLTMTAGNLATGTNTLTVNNSAIFSSSAYVSGAGTFILAGGATISTANPSGLTASGASGSIQTSTRTLSSSANYIYNGSSTQVTGNGLPANVNNLTINNSAGVSLTSSCQVNGTLALATRLGIGTGNTLTINGTVSGSGGLTGGTNSSLNITGSGNLTMPAVSTLNNFSVNRSGNVTLGSDLVVNGALALTTNLSLGGYTLTVNGTVATATGNIVGGSTSNVIVGGSSNVTLPPITGTLQNFTNNNTGNVNLSSSVNVSGNFTNNGNLNVGSHGIGGNGSGTNNGYIIAEIPNPISTNTFTQAFGSTIEYESETTLPAEFTYQNLLLNSTDTLFNLSGDIVVNETFNTENGASLDLAGYRIFFPFKYVSVAGNATISAFAPETYPEFPSIPAVQRKWTFTGNSSGSTTVFLHWDNEQGVGVDFSNGSSIWRFVDSEWVKLGVAGVPVADGATRMMVSFPATLAGKGDFSGQYAVTGNEVTLPVELSSFNASLNFAGSITLSWVTQTETNISGYRIYRGNSDSLPESTLLNVFIAGTNSSQLTNYRFVDSQAIEAGVYYYWLEGLDMDGSSSLFGPVSVTLTQEVSQAPDVPIVQGLNNAFPNPFNPNVTLSMGMEKAGSVNVAIYNARGQKVRTLFSGSLAKGSTKLHWDGKDELGAPCSSGVYFARMHTTAGDVSQLKLMLMK